MRYMKEIVLDEYHQLEMKFATSKNKQYYNQSQYDEARSEWSEFVYFYIGEAGFPALTWTQRLQIAYQAALGLNFLHTGCNPPIVHRDVKSSNILLDSNLEAKITDFGISKVWNENDTDETTVVVGTPGYLDPEYAVTCHFSDVSDVYCFGIILLEMLTGQPPIIRGPEVQQHIVQWISIKSYR
ncbi:probable LRR receptor-like serine/threonine-protein kinase PAM74 [Zingiber officinale]|uniref:probable LRR receptor-like serine/threonine-protein kinase PAM74 n=1 Tax=Zingiber officinale TaxID=94328 RepID=UPI001C4DA57C|nr:probable LRR receptor-like serine/threonine-protein kinase PAM74 [Zingiber officinale]XP_042417150.1 probable LRR receptor-like serine/threonine-protein kinase PAM74 [Zingiber officinale]XP_042417151.1 probable LRR receptor-like serine/threonine-protein kinase PAM74 [Zingiber officinale]XP_042417152.1 probable LRR receptor-like serine/threonine-protein kinase PAM74 [Zingiber officinale]